MWNLYTILKDYFFQMILKKKYDTIKYTKQNWKKKDNRIILHVRILK